MKTLLIINPYSRNGKSAVLSKKITQYFKEKKFPFEAAEIKHFSDAYHYSAAANKSGFNNIVAVGGDGTINKVLNGFFDNNGKRISGSRFGVIHTGTSPDFCKSYNIPTNVLKAAEIVMGQKIINIPVGMIRLSTEYHKNNPQGSKVFDSCETRYFACCANIGLGASLARSASSGVRAYLGDFLGTFLSFLRILVTYKGTDYTIMIDNNNIKYKNIINISVGITKYIASGIKVHRNQTISDDKFYILKAGNVNLYNITKLLRILYSGKEFVNSSHLSINYAGRIEIFNNNVHPEIEFDGDPAGFLPCSIEIAEDRLQVFSS